jgi:hypothetical protein
LVQAISSSQLAFIPPVEPEIEAEEPPGFVELTAVAEQSMPIFVQTIVDLTAEMAKLGEIATEKAARMEQMSHSAQPSVAKLVVIRELAEAYGPSAERFETLSADYVEQVERIDAGVTAIIERIPALTDPEEIAAAKGFAEAIRVLATEASAAFGGLQGFMVSLRTVNEMSSTIRPVLRRINQAVSSLLPSGDVFNRWVTTIDWALAELDSGARAD